MGVIFRDFHGNAIDSSDEAYAAMKCCVCQGPPDAYWSCHSDIAICERCALNVLPALVADAMRAKGRGTGHLLRAKEKMLSVFWRAAALALAREPEAPEDRRIRERTQRATIAIVEEELCVAPSRVSLACRDGRKLKGGAAS